MGQEFRYTPEPIITNRNIKEEHMINKYEKLAIAAIEVIKTNGRISEQGCITIANGDIGDGKFIFEMLKEYKCGSWTGYGDIKYGDGTERAISSRLFENIIKENDRKQLIEEVSFELSKAQLSDIKWSGIRSWIAIIISVLAAILSIILEQ